MENPTNKFDILNVVSTLASEYNSVYVIDTRTKELNPIITNNKVASAVKGLLAKGDNYDDIMRKFSQKYILENEKSMFMQYVDLNFVVDEIAHSGRYTYSFHRYNDEGQVELVEMGIAQLNNSTDMVMMTFKNIDTNKININQERNSMLKKHIMEERENRENIHAMGSLFYVVYRVNIPTDTFKEIRAISQISQFGNKYVSAKEAFNQMVSVMIKEPYHKRIYEFVDIPKWPEKLANKNTISEEYEGTFSGWCRINLIVTDRDSEGTVTDVIVCVQEINEEKKAEMQHKAELSVAIEEKNVISSELEHALHREQRQSFIINGFGTAFFAVCSVNLRTRKYTILKEYARRTNVVLDGHNIQDIIDYTLEEMVMEEFRANMRMFLNIDTLEVRLDRKDIITQDYIEASDIWSRCCVFVTSRDEDGNADRVLIAHRRIADEKLKEATQDNLIQALSLSFENVYSVKMNTESVICYRMGKFISGKYGNRFAYGEYSENLEFYINKEVYEEDRRLFADINSISAVKKIFKTSQSYAFNYRVLRHGEMHYFQCYLAKPTEIKDEFVIGFKNVDNEMIEELKQKEVLRSALAAAEHANKSKTRFLSNMSHDIRTPLNAIIGYTTLAQNHCDDEEQVANYLGKIRTSSDHLLSLVNEVLDMSRIESGKNFIDEKEENLKHIIDEITSIAMINVNTKNLNFTVDSCQIVDETLMLDKLKFSQILINILSNAIKYTPHGGNVDFSIVRRETSWKGYVSYEFVVTDTGIGMNKEFISRIFEPFEREYNSTVSGIQGTGLGMSITKNLVDMMGGTISVTSEKNKGTTVVVKLQFKLAEHVQKEEEKTSVNFSGRRVLIVEDNELNREIDEELLSEAGFVVDTADNGFEALEKIKNSQPGKYEVVLMDIQMPVMNGYEATKKIRELEEPLLANIPIIALTANAFDEDRKTAIASGMNEYIAKPIEMAKLLSTISEFLNK